MSVHMIANSPDPTPEFARIRLFVEDDLHSQQELTISNGQAHYLSHVMRRSINDHIRLFNGRDGEWAVQIIGQSKHRVEVRLVEQTRAQKNVPNITLAFSPIKKTPLDYLVEKSTELGVRTLQPVLMDRTQMHQVKTERLRARAIEAAEQSWRTCVPQVEEPVRLEAYLSGLGPDQPVMFCDERLGMAQDATSLERLREAEAEPGVEWVLLIGPEGGFSASEQHLIERLPRALPISLGPRIVRAETAAVVALTLWQAVRGDLNTLSD